MKDRTRKSPDLADNAVIMAQVAHSRCGMSANEFGEWNQERDTPWKRFLKKRQVIADYATTSY
jgi:hypothetical protein